MMPKITVVISTLNGCSTLEMCLKSILDQTYINLELIIIDGGSSDGTLDILKKYIHRIDYFVSESDAGIYNAWNKGLAKATGDWICFIGSDDYIWSIDVFEKISVELEGLSSNIRVAYGQVMLLDVDGKSLYPIGESWGKAKKRFNQIMSFPHPGAMHRRSLFELNGNFDESFRIAGDYELLLRELKTNDAIFIPNLITAGIRAGGISSNPKNAVAAMHEVRRAQVINGFRYPGLIWITTMIKTHIKLVIFNIFNSKLAKKILGLSSQIK